MRRHPKLVVFFVIAAAVTAVVSWRFVPPSDAAMTAVRKADVTFRSAWAPVVPEGAVAGKRLTDVQHDALQGQITEALRGSCTADYRAELPNAAHDMANRVSRELKAGGQFSPSHPYQYMRDLQFRYRTLDGALVFDVYQPGDSVGSAGYDAGFVSERIRFEKVDGVWLIADVESFGA